MANYVNHQAYGTQARALLRHIVSLDIPGQVYAEDPSLLQALGKKSLVFCNASQPLPLAKRTTARVPGYPVSQKTAASLFDLDAFIYKRFHVHAQLPQMQLQEASVGYLF